MARSKVKPGVIIGGTLAVFAFFMLGSRKSRAASKPDRAPDGMPDPEKPKMPKRPKPKPAPAPAPGGGDGGQDPYLPGVTPGGGGGGGQPGRQPGGMSDVEKEVRDAARAHNLQPTDIIGVPPLGHDVAWISEDCKRYFIGRDFMPALPFGGQYYTPGAFWQRFASNAPPNFPKEYPAKPTHEHYLRESISFYFVRDCLLAMPRRENYASPEDFAMSMDAWVTQNPEAAEFVGELEVLTYFDMMAAMKAADVERYYAWRELWHHPDDAIHRDDNEWSSRFLAEIADAAYKKAHPNDPFPIPSATHPSAEKWNRILNYVNDYRNAYYGM